MSLVLSNRSAANAASPRVLKRRIEYIADADHPSHSGAKQKTILRPRNYNVPEKSNTPDSFMKEAVRLAGEYRASRAGRGKRSTRLFEELVYRSPSDTWLDAGEREEIERRIISQFGAMAACRTAWHVDERTGSSDLHVLLSAVNLDHPPQLTLWASFGGLGHEHIYSAMDKLDTLITEWLNQNPKRQVAKLKSARARNQEAVAAAIGNQIPLGVEIASYLARHAERTEIDVDLLVATIQALHHKVHQLTKWSVTIQFHGRRKLRRFNLNKLCDNVADQLETMSFRTAPPQCTGANSYQVPHDR